MKRLNICRNFFTVFCFSFLMTSYIIGQSDFSTYNVSGTWRGYENGNRISLVINQTSNTFTGYLSFVDNPRQQKIPIKGTISESIRASQVYKIEWKRSDENHTYIGYTFSMGNDTGRGIAGYFHRPLSNGNMEPEGNMGWYVTR